MDLSFSMQHMGLLSVPLTCLEKVICIAINAMLIVANNTGLES